MPWTSCSITALASIALLLSCTRVAVVADRAFVRTDTLILYWDGVGSNRYGPVHLQNRSEVNENICCGWGDDVTSISVGTGIDAWLYQHEGQSGVENHYAPGYESWVTRNDDADSFRMRDVDECASPSHECNGATEDCVNVLGFGYECHCKDGFSAAYAPDSDSPSACQPVCRTEPPTRGSGEWVCSSANKHQATGTQCTLQCHTGYTASPGGASNSLDVHCSGKDAWSEPADSRTCCPSSTSVGPMRCGGHVPGESFTLRAVVPEVDSAYPCTTTHRWKHNGNVQASGQVLSSPSPSVAHFSHSFSEPGSYVSELDNAVGPISSETISVTSITADKFVSIYFPDSNECLEVNPAMNSGWRALCDPTNQHQWFAFVSDSVAGSNLIRWAKPGDGSSASGDPKCLSSSGAIVPCSCSALSQQLVYSAGEQSLKTVDNTVCLFGCDSVVLNAYETTVVPGISSVDFRSAMSAVLTWPQPPNPGSNQVISWTIRATYTDSEGNAVIAEEHNIARDFSITGDFSAMFESLEPGAEHTFTVYSHISAADTYGSRGAPGFSTSVTATAPCGCQSDSDGAPLLSSLDVQMQGATADSPATLLLRGSVRERSACVDDEQAGRYRVYFFKNGTHVTPPTPAQCPAESVWPATATGELAHAGLDSCAFRLCTTGAYWEDVVDDNCPDGDKLGQSTSLPAHSCRDLLEQRQGILSGTYYIKPSLSSAARSVSCEMRTTISGGGWMRADLSHFAGGPTATDELLALGNGQGRNGGLEVLVVNDAYGLDYPRYSYQLAQSELTGAVPGTEFLPWRATQTASKMITPVTARTVELPDNTVSVVCGSRRFSTDDRAESASTINLSVGFTVGFFARSLDAGVSVQFVTHGFAATSSLLHMGFHSSREFYFNLFANDMNSPVLPVETVTSLNHYVGTYDAPSGTRTLYLNGEVIASNNAGSNNYHAGNSKLSINSDGKQFDMAMLTVHMRALSHFEVRQMYETHMPEPETLILAYMLGIDGDAAGATTDSSPTGNHLSVTAGSLETLATEDCTLCNMGIIEGSTFDSAHNIDLTSGFTVSFHIKQDHANVNNMVLYQNHGLDSSRGFHMGYRSSNLMTCAFFSNDLDGPVLPANEVLQLQHWTCVWDKASNTRILYRNGVQVANDNPAGPYVGPATPLALNKEMSPRYMIDNLAVYNRPLSATEVQEMYSEQLYSSAGLVLFNDFSSWNAPSASFPDVGSSISNALVQSVGSTAPKITHVPDEANPTCAAVSPPSDSVGGCHPLELDVEDSLISEAPIDLSSGSGFSVSYWAASVSQYAFVFRHGVSSTGTGSRFVMGLYPDSALVGQFVCAFWANDLTLPVQTSMETATSMHHWTCTYDSVTGVRRAYRDGVEIGSDNPGANAYTGGSQFAYVNAEVPRHLMVDDVAVYSRALSAAEVLAQVTSRNYPDNGLVLFNSFNTHDAQSNAFTDSSPTQNDLVVHSGSPHLIASPSPTGCPTVQAVHTTDPVDNPTDPPAPPASQEGLVQMPSTAGWISGTTLFRVVPAQFFSEPTRGAVTTDARCVLSPSDIDPVSATYWTGTADGSHPAGLECDGASSISVSHWVREIAAPIPHERVPGATSVLLGDNGFWLDGGDGFGASPMCGTRSVLQKTGQAGLFSFSKTDFDTGVNFGSPLQLGTPYFVCAYVDRLPSAASCRQVLFPFRGRIKYRVVVDSDDISESAHVGVACVRVTAYLAGTSTMLASALTTSISKECNDGEATWLGSEIGEVQLDFAISDLPEALAGLTTLDVDLHFERADQLANGSMLHHTFDFGAGVEGNDHTVSVVHMDAATTPLIARDLSSQTISGVISYANSSPFTTDTMPCPIQNATVCLSLDGDQLDCTITTPRPAKCLCDTTDDDGAYSITPPSDSVATLQILSHDGRFKASRRLHLDGDADFAPYGGALDAGVSDPWMWTFTTSHVNINYELTVLERIPVRVRGGSNTCDSSCGLGQARVAFDKPSGCPAFNLVATLEPDASAPCEWPCTRHVTGDVTLYHVMLPPFLNVDAIFDSISGDTILSPAGASKAAEYFAATALTTVPIPEINDASDYTVEFLYHATPEVSIDVDSGNADLELDCGDALLGRVHVLQQNERYRVKLTAEEHYGDFGSVCSCKVEGFVEVFDEITSGMAIPAPSGREVVAQGEGNSGYHLEQMENGEHIFYIEPLTPRGATGTDQDLNFHLQPVAINILPSLRAGPSSPSGWTEVHQGLPAASLTPPIHAFVEGTYNAADGLVVELPAPLDHQRPVLSWLRNPPGDGSTSQLTKGAKQTTVISESSSDNVASENSFKVGAGTDFSTTSCTGVAGVTFVAYCTEASEMDIQAHVSHKSTAGRTASSSNALKYSAEFSDSIKTPGERGLIGADGDTAVLPSLTYTVSESFDISINRTSCQITRRPTLAWGMDPGAEESISMKTQFTICTREIQDACKGVAEFEDRLLEDGSPDLEFLATNLSLPECRIFDVSGLDVQDELRRRNTPARSQLNVCTHHYQVCEPGCSEGDNCPSMDPFVPLHDMTPDELEPTIRDVSGKTEEELIEFHKHRIRLRQAVRNWHYIVRQNCIGKREARPQRGMFASFLDDAFDSLVNSSPGNITRGDLLGAVANILDSPAESLENSAVDVVIRTLTDSLSSGVLTEYDPTNGRAVLTFEGGGSSYSHTTTYTRAQTMDYTFNYDRTVLVSAGMHVDTSFFGFNQLFERDASLSMTWGGTTSESEETELTTTVTFELSDSSLGDRFLVEVLADPFFGTPVFRTVGGRSMNPHEPGTVARHKPSLRVAGGATTQTGIPGTEAAIFNLILENESPTGDELAYELAMFGPSNTDSALVKIQQLDMTSVDLLLGAGSPLDVEISIQPNLRKKPDYELVFELYAVEEWQMWGDIGSSMSSYYLTSEVYLSASFLFPCAQIEWKGDLLLDNKFVVNAGSDSLLPVIVFNPETAINPWTAMPRMKWVRLQFRREGEASWTDQYMRLPTDDATLVGHNLADDEDDTGYAAVVWDLAHQEIQDGAYEIRIKALCEASSHTELDVSYSTSIRGVVDREVPEMFGTPEPSDGVFVPFTGEEIVVDFTEPIDCNRDVGMRAFVLAQDDHDCSDVLTKSDAHDFFETDRMQAVCRGDSYEFRFSSRASLSSISGRTVCMLLNGVADLNGNVATNVAWHFSVPTLELDAVPMVVSKLPINVSSTETDAPGWVADLLEELSSLLQVPTTRLNASVAPDPRYDDMSLLEVNIEPDESGSGAVADEVANQLVNYADNGPGLGVVTYPRLSSLQPVTEDTVVAPLAAVATTNGTTCPPAPPTPEPEPCPAEPEPEPCPPAAADVPQVEWTGAQQDGLPMRIGGAQPVVVFEAITELMSRPEYSCQAWLQWVPAGSTAWSTDATAAEAMATDPDNMQLLRADVNTVDLPEGDVQFRAFAACDTFDETPSFGRATSVLSGFVDRSPPALAGVVDGMSSPGGSLVFFFDEQIECVEAGQAPAISSSVKVAGSSGCDAESDVSNEGLELIDHLQFSCNQFSVSVSFDLTADASTYAGRAFCVELLNLHDTFGNVNQDAGTASFIASAFTDDHGPVLIGDVKPSDGFLAPGAHVEFQFSEPVACHGEFAPVMSAVATTGIEGGCSAEEDTSPEAAAAAGVLFFTCEGSTISAAFDPMTHYDVYSSRSFCITIEGVRDGAGNFAEQSVNGTFFKAMHTGTVWEYMGLEWSGEQAQAGYSLSLGGGVTDLSLAVEGAELLGDSGAAALNCSSWVQFVPAAADIIEWSTDSGAAVPLVPTPSGEVTVTVSVADLPRPVFKIRGAARCDNGGSSVWRYTRVLTGSIDETAPQLLRVAPADGMVPRMGSLDLVFDDDIDCMASPPVLSVVATESSAGGCDANADPSPEAAEAGSAVELVCSGRTLSVRFSPNVAQSVYSGRSFCASIMNVHDESGNTDPTMQLDFAVFSPELADDLSATVRNLHVLASPPNGWQGMLQAALESRLGVGFGRVQVVPDVSDAGIVHIDIEAGQNPTAEFAANALVAAMTAIPPVNLPGIDAPASSNSVSAVDLHVPGSDVEASTYTGAHISNSAASGSSAGGAWPFSATLGVAAGVGLLVLAALVVVARTRACAFGRPAQPSRQPGSAVAGSLVELVHHRQTAQEHEQEQPVSAQEEA